MFRSFVILSLCLVAINASGEFSVLNTPTSLDFKGNEKLESESLGDVLSASLGYWVDDGTKWSGLYVNDPFSTAKSAVAVLVTGVDHLNLNTKAKTYSMTGSSSEESLNALSSELESSNVAVGNLDFSQLNDALLSFADVFGEAPSHPSPIKATNSLKPDLHSEDEEFLTQIAYINEVANKYAGAAQLPNLLTIRLSVDPIAKTHGEKSQAMVEATKLISNALEKLSDAVKEATKGEGLLIAVAEKSEFNRVKRATNVSTTPTPPPAAGATAAPPAAAAAAPAAAEPEPTDLNLATYYNNDYPVIFNLILWFMVVFGFSLLAICYSIGSMDPGRDSIIYRMTSTRMKKDN